MRFLFDECLFDRLTLLARERGHEADHVNWLGLGGTTDWGLMATISEGDYVFVTNNAADFRKLFAKEEIHGGLVIILPSVKGAMQIELFEAFLDSYGDADLVNMAIEIAIDGDEVLFTDYPIPDPEA